MLHTNVKWAPKPLNVSSDLKLHRFRFASANVQNAQLGVFFSQSYFFHKIVQLQQHFACFHLEKMKLNFSCRSEEIFHVALSKAEPYITKENAFDVQIRRVAIGHNMRKLQLVRPSRGLRWKMQIPLCALCSQFSSGNSYYLLVSDNNFLQTNLWFY